MVKIAATKDEVSFIFNRPEFNDSTIKQRLKIGFELVFMRPSRSSFMSKNGHQAEQCH